MAHGIAPPLSWRDADLFVEHAREFVLARVAGLCRNFLDAQARFEKEIFGLFDSEPEPHLTRWAAEDFLEPVPERIVIGHALQLLLGDF